MHHVPTGALDKTGRVVDFFMITINLKFCHAVGGRMDTCYRISRQVSDVISSRFIGGQTCVVCHRET